MKFISTIIFYITFCSCVVYCSELYKSSCTQNAENLFKTHVELYDSIIFTHVPRGLIVSIDEAVFFESGREKIKLSALPVLDKIGVVLNALENDFVIEGHTKNVDLECFDYYANWELSLARANNITKYLIRYAKVPPHKLFTVGFGEFMPFYTNVSNKANMDERIDFVILDYEASR